MPLFILSCVMMLVIRLCQAMVDEVQRRSFPSDSRIKQITDSPCFALRPSGQMYS